jgi:hypothetical protein
VLGLIIVEDVLVLSEYVQNTGTKLINSGPENVAHNLAARGYGFSCQLLSEKFVGAVISLDSKTL